MHDWITGLGARTLADDRITFDTPDGARRALDGTAVTPLVQFGILDVLGSGTEAFLQGQASAQVAHANGDFAPLTTFCTPKGRMLANAQLLRVAEGHYRLLMHESLVATLAEHLNKFAPFYKVELRQRDDMVVLGLIGQEAGALADVRLNMPPPSPWHQSGDADTQLLAHPGPRQRLLAILPTQQATAIWPRLAEQATPVDNAIWNLHDIQAGLGWLTSHHRDALLPQMINWEALGGISFKKGCYTGQEVVARAHFRGQVKRRLMRGQLEGNRLPGLGSPVLDEQDKSVGEVLAAELDAYDQAEVLIVMSTKEDIGPLSVVGQKLKLLKLPYPVERLDPEGLATS